MIVQRRSTFDPVIVGPAGKAATAWAIARTPIDAAPLRMFPSEYRAPWSLNWLPNRALLKTMERINPDIVHLHWIAGGFVPIHSFRALRRPLVWTMHDMWTFTGGCHLDDGCSRYVSRCGACPQLGSSREHDLSRLVWWLKARSWRHVPLVIVSPSRWLANLARSSGLLHRSRIEVIPNGLDLHAFKPLDKHFARRALGLPQDGQLLIFGAMGATEDRRKGFDMLLQVLQRLRVSMRDTLRVGVFGGAASQSSPDIPFPMHFLGRLHDDASLALLYSAADVMVVPSKQENLANTIMEPLACGTPVVAFNAGGTPDLIDHKVNGYMAAPDDAADMAEGVAWVLRDIERHRVLSTEARSKCERNFNIVQVADQHLELYVDLLSAPSISTNSAAVRT